MRLSKLYKKHLFREIFSFALIIFATGSLSSWYLYKGLSEKLEERALTVGKSISMRFQGFSSTTPHLGEFMREAMDEYLRIFNLFRSNSSQLAAQK